MISTTSDCDTASKSCTVGSVGYSWIVFIDDRASASTATFDDYGKVYFEVLCVSAGEMWLDYQVELEKLLSCDLPLFKETIKVRKLLNQCYYKPFRLDRFIGRREKRVGLRNHKNKNNVLP